MNKFKYWLRNFFGFSQKETNGFIILTLLMLVFIFVPTMYNALIEDSPDTSVQDRKKLDSLVASWEIEKEDSSMVSLANFSEKKFNQKNLEYFLFNPNTCGVEDFQKLGLRTYLAERIVKYREKGGRFKNKTDLKKIYGFPPSLYEKLERYIDLPEVNNFSRPPDKQTSFDKRPVRNSKHSFDINKADTTEFIALRGIGSKLAVRIIKYRDKLGGFISVDQYQEIYGLDTLALSELKKYAFIKKDFIPEKLKLNSVDMSILFAHPYIGKKFAKVLFNYRQEHGAFHSMEELSAIKILDPISLEKMKNYLSLE